MKHWSTNDWLQACLGCLAVGMFLGLLVAFVLEHWPEGNEPDEAEPNEVDRVIRTVDAIFDESAQVIDMLTRKPLRIAAEERESEAQQ